MSPAEIRAKAGLVVTAIYKRCGYPKPGTRGLPLASVPWETWIQDAFAEVFPDPPPKPLPMWALQLREEPDPKEREWLWSWWVGRGFQVRHVTIPDKWETPTTWWFAENVAHAGHMAERLRLLSDLVAFRFRLPPPDGRPCDENGKAKP